MSQPHHIRLISVAVLSAAALMSLPNARAQSPAAQAAAQTQQSMSGAQGGLGTQPGLAQGGLGVQSGAGGQVQLPLRRNGVTGPQDNMPQGTPATPIAQADVRGAANVDMPRPAPEVKPSVAKKAAKAVKRTQQRARTGVPSVDSSVGVKP